MDIIFNFLYFIDDLIKNNLLISILIYSIFIYLYSLFCLPGIVFIWIFLGYSFGIYIGYFLSIIFSVLGFLSIFLISKFFLNSFFYNYFKNHIIKIEKILDNNSYELLILFRMLPINFPYLIQNIALSFLKISSLKFIIVSLIGLSPIIIFCCIIGNTIDRIKEIENVSITNSIVSSNFIYILFILIFFILLRIYFKFRK